MTGDARDGIFVAVSLAAALSSIVALALVPLPIVAHLAWNVFVHYWNVV